MRLMMPDMAMYRCLPEGETVPVLLSGTHGLPPLLRAPAPGTLPPTRPP